MRCLQKGKMYTESINALYKKEGKKNRHALTDSHILKLFVSLFLIRDNALYYEYYAFA